MIEQTQDIDRKRTLMSQLTLVYISLSGNTQSFVKRMSDYLSLNHGINCRQINIKELNHDSYQPTLKVGMVLTMEMLKS